MKLVQVYKNGKMEDVEIKATNKTLINKLERIAKIRGGCSMKELYAWKYDNKVIISYGWIEGEDSNINAHNLVTDGYSKYLDTNSSDIKLYGDIFICCMEGKKYRDFDILKYGEFYTNNNLYDDYCTDSSDYEDEEAIEEPKYINNLKKKETKKSNNVEKLKRDNSDYI